ncbi:DUF3333 domain-containing protein, partial [Devosia sp.]
MTDQQAPGRKQATERTKLIRAGLRRRHLNEQIFRILGIVAICAALGFVALLFTDVMRKGIPAFHQASLHLTVTFDPAIIKVDPEPVQEA